jgi:hypothetical protein
MWQRQLDNKLGSLMPAWQEWAPLIGQIGPSVRNNSFASILARLAAMSRAEVNTTQLLRAALLDKPLPNDHAGDETNQLPHSKKNQPSPHPQKSLSLRAR